MGYRWFGRNCLSPAVPSPAEQGQDQGQDQSQGSNPRLRSQGPQSRGSGDSVTVVSTTKGTEAPPLSGGMGSMLRGASRWLRVCCS
ncbi:hypothetical protein ElyMa_000430700 [Elysia marginata]|uniref:Uncharacterized protein n=1 Tax=Elysia marginata TaxID=1093978 RepID=A0AAV4FMX0_9GAST|nr:hypothetical protein ElyMa_000430700 [Elysia marginata]